MVKNIRCVMFRFPLLSVVMAWLAGAPTLGGSPPVHADDTPGATPDAVSQLVAHLIAEGIPREFERTKDWGRTRQITTGLRSSGNFFDFDIHRRKRQVNHGVWRHYRLKLVEPEKNLVVRVEHLRMTEPGRIALTVFASAKLHGWARAKVYESGIHLGAVEAEGDASVRLWIETEIAVETIRSKSLIPGLAIRPVVTNARLEFDDFRLSRISDVQGPLVRELGQGLHRLLEDELTGPKLVAALNRSLEKHRQRLEFNSNVLFEQFAPKKQTEADSPGPSR